MAMVPTLLRQFRRSLQIKKCVANAPRVLYLAELPKYTYQSITVKKDWLLGNVAIKAVEVAQKHKQKLAHGEFYPQWK